MSDYLWDKTGAADPEVRRLEALLGDLAHRPRPLELPATERRARRAPLLQYAAAAALLLAVLAGALVALRLARPSDPGPVAASAPAPTHGPRESASPPAPPKETNPLRDETAPRGRQAHLTANKPRRAPRRTAPVSVAEGARAGSTASAPSVAREDQRLRAKEQLVYALRLTGVKLEEVRRRVQGEPDTPAAPGRTR